MEKPSPYHARICFASTRKVFHQARPVSIPLSLGMYLSALEVREAWRHIPNHHFPLLQETGGADPLPPMPAPSPIPIPFKIRRTRLSQFSGKEAILVAKAKWHPWPSEHLTKVLEYFSFLNCSRVCWFFFYQYSEFLRKKKRLSLVFFFFNIYIFFTTTGLRERRQNIIAL